MISIVILIIGPCGYRHEQIKCETHQRASKRKQKPRMSLLPQLPCVYLFVCLFVCTVVCCDKTLNGILECPYRHIERSEQLQEGERVQEEADRPDEPQGLDIPLKEDTQNSGVLCVGSALLRLS